MPVLRLALVSTLAVLWAAAPAMAAQAGAAPPQPVAEAKTEVQAKIGAKVRDSKGKLVGHIEKLVAGPDGRPRQALVSVNRVLRTLPLDALAWRNGAYVTVLSRDELMALPPSN